APLSRRRRGALAGALSRPRPHQCRRLRDSRPGAVARCAGAPPAALALRRAGDDAAAEDDAVVARQPADDDLAVDVAQRRDVQLGTFLGALCLGKQLLVQFLELAKT